MELNAVEDLTLIYIDIVCIICLEIEIKKYHMIGIGNIINIGNINNVLN